MLIRVNKDEDYKPDSECENYFLQDSRCIADLLYVYHSNCYINEKGYLTKLIDKLHECGYYEDNETIFLKKGI